MYRKFTLIGMALVIMIVSGVVSAYFFMGPEDPSSLDDQGKQYINESMEDITKVGDQPTQDYKLPNGLYTKVIAGQVTLKITNPDTVASYGDRLTPIPYLPQTYRLNTGSSDLDQTINDALKKPGVVFAQPNFVTTGSQLARNVPNDPRAIVADSGQRGQLLDISAFEGWAVSTTGADIAVLDTGIQSSHPDLSAKIRGDGVNFVTPGGSVEDDHGHGTHTGGIAAARTNNATGVAGVSWSSRIMPIKVLDSNMAGNTDMLSQGIRYAVGRGVRVISMSVNTDSDYGPLREAVAFAAASNVVLVNSVGNVTAGPETSIAYPAAYESVIGVGATTVGTTPPKRDDISRYGASGPMADLSAPGNRIISTAVGNSYQSRSGTSASAPMVAGAAALILGLRPDLSAVRVEAILKATADGPASRGIGAGRLNLYKALVYARNCP